MRKITVFSLTVLMLVTLCLLPVSAADTPEEVTLSVSIQRNEKITSGGIEFIYDKNIFEFIKGKWAVDDYLISDFDLEKSRGVFAFDGDKTIEEDIFIATLHTNDKKAINEDTTISAIVTLMNVNGEIFKIITIKEGGKQ